MKQQETTVSKITHPKRILVTGDAGTDLDTYLPFAGPNPPPGSKPTRIRQSLGGAGLAHRILTQWAGPNAAAQVGFLPPLEFASPVFAVWNLVPAGKSLEKAEFDEVWRLVHSVNPGELDPASTFTPPAPVMPRTVNKNFKPGVILIQDDAASYRHPRGANLPVAAFWKSRGTRIVWKMSYPFCRGDLWWAAQRDGVLDRSVVVLTLGDLRRSSVRVSAGISWERTALELIHELETNPELAGLHQAAHVVVSIRGEGALWRRRTCGSAVYNLVFDAAHMEREGVKGAAANGGGYGFATTFAAALTAGLAAPSVTVEDQLLDAIRNGLHAMRFLCLYGHGPEPKDALPDFPLAQVSDVIRSGKAGLVDIPSEPFATFADVLVPVEEALKMDADWCIALADQRPSAAEPLYGLARRVAVYGDSQLSSVPYARFEKLQTADRNEIEALRNLKTLIDGYVKNPRMTKPLSLAVFGPPGAGKSFGVEQIATEVLGEALDMRTFNLSQFSEVELAGAFHQVRDMVLNGKMPLVFWDEFDSNSYAWLQHLLAPMNDGHFQEGQITHPIGRCIFVFAGGTSDCIENFGPSRPPEGTPPDSPEAVAWQRYQLLKGPDFISRIHGSLNVLGPNPVKKRDGATTDKIEDTQSAKAGHDSPCQDANRADVSFPLRRAILLRAFLGCKPRQRLAIDPGLLAALLEVGRYINGSRSFEKICEAIKNAAGASRPFQPSHLPSDAVLAMNIADVPEFKRLLTRDAAFQDYAEMLAPAIHRSYQPLSERNNPNNAPYEALPADVQADNLAAARRIPWLLGLAGLYVAEPGAEGALTREQALAILSAPPILERLAEEEHDLWVAVKRANGWQQGKRNDVARKHDLLIPYRDLDERQRDKDRGNIRGIPERVEMAGFVITARKPDAAS